MECLYLDGKHNTHDIDLDVLDKFIKKMYNYKDHGDKDFNEDNHHKNTGKLYDFDCIVINDFPVSLIKQLLDIDFETKKIAYSNICLHHDLIKYLYANWNNINIKKKTNRLKNHLIDTANGLMNKIGETHYLYYTFWLYSYYPLLDDGE